MKRKTVFLGMLAILLASVLNLQAQTNQIRTNTRTLQDSNNPATIWTVLEYSTNGGGSWTLLPADYDGNGDCEYGQGIQITSVSINSGATTTNSTSLNVAVNYSMINMSTPNLQYRICSDNFVTSCTAWTNFTAGGMNGNYSFTPAYVHPQSMPAQTGIGEAVAMNVFVQIQTSAATFPSNIVGDATDQTCAAGAGVDQPGGICLWKPQQKRIFITAKSFSGAITGATENDRIMTANNGCKNSANNPNGSGNGDWRALICFNGRDITDIPYTKFVRVDGTVIANNKTDFLNGSHINSIGTSSSFTANGCSVGGFTNNTTGSSPYRGNCSNWTNTTGSNSCNGSYTAGCANTVASNAVAWYSGSFCSTNMNCSNYCGNNQVQYYCLEM